MQLHRALPVVAASCLSLACAPEEPSSTSFTTTLTTGITTAETSDSNGDGDPGDGDPTGDGDGDPGGDGDGDPLKLDTIPFETSVDDGSDPNCDFVDLLFVIDNSVSMGGYQQALGLAFPQFADTLAAVLPEGVNLHVGVTSSEMGYAGSGSTSIFNGVCTFTGDGMPSDNFYITPDQQNTHPEELLVHVVLNSKICKNNAVNMKG